MLSSIRAKLIMSFGAVIVMVLFMSIFSVQQTLQSNSGFHQFQKIASDSSLASNIQSDMLLMRLSVFKYLSNPSPEQVDAFNRIYVKTESEVNEAQASINNPERKQIIERINAELHEYQEGFLHIQKLLSDSQAILANNLNVNGKTIEKNLTRIQRTARQDGMTVEAFEAAEGLRTLLLARLYTIKFIQSHLNSDLERALTEFKNLRGDLIRLEQAVQDPTRSQLLQESVTLINTYIQGVNSIDQLITQSNDILKKKLNVIGPQVFSQANAINQSIHDEKDVLGLYVDKLNRNTEIALIVIGLIVLLLVAAVAYLIPKSIDKGLKDIKLKLRKICDHGDFSIRADESRKDEIGDMGKAINGLVHNIEMGIDESNKVITAIANGQFDQRVTAPLKGDLETLKKGINSSANAIDHTLNELGKVITAMSEGQFSVEIYAEGKGKFKTMFDQLTSCMGNLNHSFQNINDVMDSMQHGHFDKRINSQAAGDLQKLKNRINNTLDTMETIIDEVVKVLVDFSHGNLTNTIHTEVEGDLLTLKDAINTTSAKLSEVVSKSVVATKTVSTAASEVSQGSTDLSQRVQEQAAAIEETSATMEEINSTVEHNADNARKANDIAHTVKDKSESGAKVMAETITAMNAIQDSSHKISEIVTLIDSIAFQTNLLALNAAVEAARAGEHGRGFAVVAGEVRNLAQKSADAAKDITSLINESVTRIDQGTKLAGESGDVLNEINTSINDVVEMIEHITQASIQQTEGIRQVHKAIGQIDEVTQQNAALVEQTAAAADSMAEQSEGLEKEMSFFHVARNAIPSSQSNIKPKVLQTASTEKSNVVNFHASSATAKPKTDQATANTAKAANAVKSNASATAPSALPKPASAKSSEEWSEF